MPFLVQTRGPGAGSAFPVTGVCLLGRNHDCDIVVPHESVSRHHARIVAAGDSYLVEDLNSRNGTMLNNIAIHGRCQLSDGDVLRLSIVEFAYREVLDDNCLEWQKTDDTTRLLIDEDNGRQPALVELALDMRPRYDVSRAAATAQAKLNALLDITKSLGGCFSPEKIYAQTLDCLFAMIPQAERGCIVLVDAQGELRPALAQSRRSPRSEHRISRTVIERAIGSKRAILSRDALHDPRFQGGESVALLQIRSIMCAPLVDDNGEVFGVIQVETGGAERAFHQEELELLMGVATQAAMAITLARLHEKELQRRTMERDLELAAAVQRDLLPQSAPQNGAYRFSDYYCPAEVVGGDYYDYVETPSGEVAVIIADVAGHGIAAALSMSKLSAEVRLLVATMQSPGAILTTLNQNMFRQRLDARFITLAIAKLDPRQHFVTLACAGHMPPILRRHYGKLTSPNRNHYGPPLGAVEHTQYGECTFGLDPGDSLTLYTDGITEAVNPGGEFYGLGRLHRQILKACEPETIKQEVIGDLAQFVGEQPQEDDICFVAFGRARES